MKKNQNWKKIEKIYIDSGLHLKLYKKDGYLIICC